MDLYECSILIIGYLQIILLTMWSLYLHFAERISQQKYETYESYFAQVFVTCHHLLHIVAWNFLKRIQMKWPLFAYCYGCGCYVAISISYLK